MLARMPQVNSKAIFPSTRYQGSKRRLAGAILENLAELDFSTVLDAFGGTGAVSHAFKQAGKQVTYNDALLFNQQIGLALIENDTVRVRAEDVARVGQRRSGVAYGDLIERNFDGIYYTGEENRWLDTAVGNIRATPCRYTRALLWFALFQSAMAKRPYNLFHRSNLYMRSADVERSFGNKTTWERSFDDHLAAFAGQANRAVIDGCGACQALCGDALSVAGEFDLVYIDPPYINARGVGVDYHHFYHLLEGMVRYDDWPSLIDYRSRHRRLRRQSNPWRDASRALSCFLELFHRFKAGTIVVSYRSNGLPRPEEIEFALKSAKRRVLVRVLRQRQYALSTVRNTRELLIIGRS
jgi:16S rRNA G966 N2-methylase RsmD